MTGAGIQRGPSAWNCPPTDLPGVLVVEPQVFADERGWFMPGHLRRGSAERLHVLCFTEAVDGIRVISFRKANSREVARYAKVKAAR